MKPLHFLIVVIFSLLAISGCQTTNERSFSSNTLASRGYTLIRENRFEEGFKDIIKAVELDPNSVKALWMRSWAYNLKGMYNEALSDLEKIHTIDPDNPSAMNLKGWIYIKLERYQDAITELNKVLSIIEVSAFYDTRGWAFFYLERLADARRDAKSALKLDPEYYPSRALIYRIDFAQGNKKEASLSLQKYIIEHGGEENANPKTKEKKEILDNYFLLLKYFVNEVSIEELQNTAEWDDLRVALYYYI